MTRRGLHPEWAELWGDSYGHLHTSLAPHARTMPRFTVGGELYEVRNDWEFSGWVKWRRYPTTNVYMLGPQIGRYLETWYLRLRTSLIEWGDLGRHAGWGRATVPRLLRLVRGGTGGLRAKR
jgi:YaiO family outer membrane protein